MANTGNLTTNLKDSIIICNSFSETIVSSSPSKDGYKTSVVFTNSSTPDNFYGTETQVQTGWTSTLPTDIFSATKEELTYDGTGITVTSSNDYTNYTTDLWGYARPNNTGIGAWSFYVEPAPAVPKQKILLKLKS